MCANKNAGIKTITVHQAWQKGSVTKGLCAATAASRTSTDEDKAESDHSLGSGDRGTLGVGAQGNKASLVTMERTGVQASRG